MLAIKILARDTNFNSTINHTLAYDKSGNLTDDGQAYNYTYDALGRLTRVWTW